MSLPTAHDVWFLTRAILTRPGDVPGIIRRGAARKRANLPTSRGADPDGLRVLTDSWEAALAANAFRAPAGGGAAVDLGEAIDLTEAIGRLQFASAVTWGEGFEPIHAALSFEAARLSLPQSARAPEALIAARRAFAGKAEVSDRLRAALVELADAEVARR